MLKQCMNEGVAVALRLGIAEPFGCTGGVGLMLVSSNQRSGAGSC
jgi:hypothetical protein